MEEEESALKKYAGEALEKLLCGTPREQQEVMVMAGLLPKPSSQAA